MNGSKGRPDSGNDEGKEHRLNEEPQETDVAPPVSRQ
jgi:hypothetical protein